MYKRQALFSVPRPFSEKYIWTYDFDSYPWKVNLKRLDEAALPALCIRDRKNLQMLTTDADPTTLTTRLYPLGYGEGVNQLGIGGVNNGLPVSYTHLVLMFNSPPHCIDGATRIGSEVNTLT